MEPSRRDRRKSAPDPASAVTIRDLSTHDDYERCVVLQRATWGDDFRELVPPAVLMIARKLGGVALGAFGQDGSLWGFVFGLTGFHRGEAVHWSHMLAVDEDRRDHGIGRRLKLAQRDRVRALGVRRIQWTFDPLVARNAHLNLTVLGARVIEYVEDMYGDNPMSRTDSVIGSDRLVVEWLVDDMPSSTVSPETLEAPLLRVTPPAPIPTQPPPDTVVDIGVPRDIQELKRRAADEARQWRSATRAWLTHYLGRGYAVRGFLPASGTLGGRYRLERVIR